MNGRSRRPSSRLVIRTWKRWAARLMEQAYALYLAYHHPRTSWHAKVFVALVVGYVFSPIDPIPDFIPVPGLLDEMVVVPIRVLVAAKLVPEEVFAECKVKAREMSEGDKPVSRAGWRSLSACGCYASRLPPFLRCVFSETRKRSNFF